MANYAVDPALLLPYLPAYTELDYYDGKCYVSLVGFMFKQVKIKGISIPFHTNFPEVNLRLYVKHTAADGSVQRGVVFISEIVPKIAIAWVANNIYREKYLATTMNYSHHQSEKEQRFDYSWKWKGKNNLISASVQHALAPIQDNTEEAFIFEHYYGFAKVNAGVTNQYTVEHPSWNTHTVDAYTVDCDFEKCYGSQFAFLDRATPASVFVAAGSAVAIREKTVLKKEKS